MPTDARIPLQVENRNYAQPLIDLAEKQRVDSLTQSQLASANQSREIGAQTIASNNRIAQQQTRELDANAMLSIVHDMESMKGLLEQGQVKPALQLGAGSLRQKLLDSGEDVTALDGILTGIQNSPESGVQYLTEALSSIKPKVGSLMAAAGIVPAQPEVLSGSDVTPQGQIIRMVNGVPIATNVQDFKPDAQEGPRLSLYGRVGSDGKIQSIQGDDRGNFYDLSGKRVELGAGDRLIENPSLTGAADEIGLTNSEAEKLRDSEVAAKTFMATAGDALSLLESSPDINTFVAAASGLVNNLEQEARAIARATGANIDFELLDTSKNGIDALGIQNQQMKGLVTALAFQAASASGQSGRDVTERDFNRFLREIGGNASDPRAFARSIQDVAQRVDRGFRINYSTRLGKEFDGELGLGSLVPQTTQANDLSTLSDDELFQ